METLLTPAESMAFQSFLSSVDTSQAPPGDWSMYSSQFNPNSIRRDDEDILLDQLPSPHENDALTKATKDLMSLDGGVWHDGGMMLAQSHHQQLEQQQIAYDRNMSHHRAIQQSHQSSHILSQHIQGSYSTVHDPFPFLNSKSLPQQPPYQQQHHHHQSGIHQPSQSPFSRPHQHPPQVHLDLNRLQTQTSQTDKFLFPASQQAQVSHSPLARSHSQSSTSATSSVTAGKRAARPSTAASRAASSSTSSQTNKRAAASFPRGQSPHSNGNNAAKPALLSPSQKKANHIQSEQKRRANIRRGYEALCETVPALREAIREEEEEARLAITAATVGLQNGKSKSTGAKKRVTTKKGKEGEDSGRDKIDGRAGPRSENVVLSKTIDYVNELLSERSTLLARLQRARQELPSGHPASIPLSPTPAWEREWKGGDGTGDDVDGEDGEDSDDMDDSEEAESPAQVAAAPPKGSRKKGKDGGKGQEKAGS